MLKKNLGDSSFIVYLAALSFYSAPNSQMFKMIQIPFNETCFALNQDSYFEFTPEDQIAVSFICNDILNIYRVCMRPNVEINFHNYINKSTNAEKEGGVL
jgi:hypothetical protein